VTPERLGVTPERLGVTPERLLTTGTTTVVFSSLGGTADSQYQECTYGYSCVPTGDGLPTNITVLDTSDKANPQKRRVMSASGSLLAARRIGEMVHVVLYDAPIEQRLMNLAQVSIAPKSCVTSTAGYQEEMKRIDATRAAAVAANHQDE
jgi:hypothetical protein